MGDGRHEYSLATPAGLKDGRAHVIRVEIAGTGHGVGESAMLAKAVGQAPPDDFIRGSLDVADGREISGWAWMSNQPGVALRIDVYADERMLATVVADQFRLDLREVGIGDGKHSFRFPTPTSLRDGSPHAIRIKLTGTDRVIAERAMFEQKP